ncbi:MAG: FtsB family cell division protein [bacterium]
MKNLIIFLLLLSIFFGPAYYNNYKKTVVARERLEALESQIIKKEQTKKELQETLANLNNSQYIEHIAREHLGLVKSGEILLIPVEKDSTYPN